MEKSTEKPCRSTRERSRAIHRCYLWQHACCITIMNRHEETPNSVSHWSIALCMQARIEEEMARTLSATRISVQIKSYGFYKAAFQERLPQLPRSYLFSPPSSLLDSVFIIPRFCQILLPPTRKSALFSFALYVPLSLQIVDRRLASGAFNRTSARLAV
jgi:hypothetical protein